LSEKKLTITMKPYKTNITVPGITILLAALITVVSLVGLLTPDFYSNETLNWQVQSRGQDMIDLFLIVPALFVTKTISLKKKNSLLLWMGTLLYITYTFVIYCFDVHFNSLFPVYCSILGLSFYSFCWTFYKHIMDFRTRPIVDIRMSRTTGIYFVLVSLSFYLLWLADIIPSAISNSTPANLRQSGLPTNPVHVIDLSFFLPAIFVTGIWLLRKKRIAPVLAIILLFFFILMDITIGWLTIKMKQDELTSGNAVIAAMAALATISFVLLIWNLRAIQYEDLQLTKQASKNSSISD
jgi:hypothetical protein